MFTDPMSPQWAVSFFELEWGFIFLHPLIENSGTINAKLELFFISFSFESFLEVLFFDTLKNPKVVCF